MPHLESGSHVSGHQVSAGARLLATGVENRDLRIQRVACLNHLLQGNGRKSWINVSSSSKNCSSGSTHTRPLIPGD